MELYANLHSHSTHSDGVYTPYELAKNAKEEGYGAIAVTDHDTATAYPELKAACAELGMECIFGVEFSVRLPKDYHIVAFNFDPEYPPMKKYLADMGARQTDNTKHCFDEAVSKGDICGITWEEVLEFNKNIIWLCNDHVWRAMLAKGLVKKEEYVAWFDKNFAKQRAKYPPVHDFLPLPELVALVKAAGGFCVVAHPHGQLDDIDYLMSVGVEGLEAWHASLTPEERERALKIGLEKGLFISGGSDHEGLLGGMYSSFSDEESLKRSCYYLPPHSVGTTKEYFEEIKMHKIMRDRL